MPEAIGESWLEFWNTQAGPFLLWWMLACSLLVLLAEIAHRLLSERHIALKAYLWKLTAVSLAVLPLTYILFPAHTQISMQALYQRFVHNDLEYPPAVQANLFAQWNANVKNKIGSPAKPVGVFENAMEIPTLPTLGRNLPGGQAEISDTNPSGPVNPAFTVYGIGGIIYGLGILFAILISLLKHVRLHAFLATTRPCAAQTVLAGVNQTARALELRRPIQVRVCEEKISPAVVGLFHPTLVIPAFLVNEWRPEELETILYHELNHLRGRDYFFVCLDSFLKTVLWFFPVVYWLHRRSDETREALSDARAIQHSRTARDYAQLILRLAESLVPQSSPVHICFYTRRGDRVLRRFSRILTFGGNTETACAWKNGFPLVLAMSMLLFFLSGLRVAPLEGFAGIAPPGKAAFDPGTNAYHLEGAELYWAYAKVSGPFSISAQIQARSADGRPLQGWAYLAILSDLTAERTAYAAGHHVDKRLSVWQGKITVEENLLEGYGRRGNVPAAVQDGWIRITRKENGFRTYYYNDLIDDWLLHDEMSLALKDPIYVGIGVWSADLSRSVIGTFSELKLEKTDN